MDLLVSVVIPVYNTEKYLEKCLDSVIGQTYGNLEIIIVDDGSKDGSLELCRDYAKKDERVTIISQENKGLAVARNVALDIATGSYIMFVDSDDWLEKEAVERLVFEAEKNMADAVFFGVIVDNDLYRQRRPLSPRKLDSGFDVLALFVKEKNITSTVWDKFYSARVFKELRFYNVRKYEDRFILPDICAVCNKVVFIEDCLYNQYIRSGSLVRSSFSESDLCYIDCERHLKECVERNIPKCGEYVKALEIDAYAGALRKLLVSHQYTKRNDLFNELFDGFKNSYKKATEKYGENIDLSVHSRYLIEHSKKRSVWHYSLIGVYLKAKNKSKAMVKWVVKLWK